MDNIKEIWLNYQQWDEKNITLEGWVRSNRCSGQNGFIVFNDGSYSKHVQLVYKNNLTDHFEEMKTVRNGSAIYIEGKIILTPNAQQPFEILVLNGKLLKQADEDYPLQKKKHTNEYLREIAHLRPSTNLFTNLMRIRSYLFHIINNYFYENNFIWVTTPVLTSNDAEGAGEAFKLAKINNEEFFNEQATLSVTGQLHAEAYALAFKKVYTFGPQFRAEKSHTNRHCAEFWMLEPEVSFLQKEGLMDLMEDLIKYIVKQYLDLCKVEIEFLINNVDIDLINKLNNILDHNFIRISYTQVIDLLIEAQTKHNVKFENNEIKWGMDLDSEHERYVCEKLYNAPVFVYDYPSQIKAFYMKQNNDQKTVAGVDLLVPGVGELCGGSERETNYDLLLAKAQNTNINIEQLQWYLNLRKYGYYKSSGFGLGFERLIMFLTSVNNIRDVIPFARSHGSIKF